MMVEMLTRKRKGNKKDPNFKYYFSFKMKKKKSQFFFIQTCLHTVFILDIFHKKLHLHRITLLKENVSICFITTVDMGFV